MNVQLTKDSEYLICSLYKSYKEKRKSGIPKQDAKQCGSSGSIHKDLMPEWSFEDVDETCRELHRADLLHCEYADNVCYFVLLTDRSIIYMENRFTDGLSQVLEYMAKIKSAIFF